MLRDPALADEGRAKIAFAAAHLARDGAGLGPGVHPVPHAIEERVARHKLATLGVRVGALGEAQRAYLEGWRAT
jgi:adenosylhomocysteinase